jgi:hypothetical protein
LIFGDDMGGSFNGMDFNAGSTDYNKIYKQFQTGSSKGYNYGGRDFSWYDTALGRGSADLKFEDVYEKGKPIYTGGGSYQRVVGHEQNLVSSASDQYNAWWSGAQERIKEANEMAYQKVMRGEISAEDYKKLTSQTVGTAGLFGGEATSSLGSFSSGQAGKVTAFAKKQEDMQKARVGTKTAMGQLAPGIREQSSEVVKGLLKNQAKETLLGKA